jgi:hypothetical protein
MHSLYNDMLDNLTSATEEVTIAATSEQPNTFILHYLVQNAFYIAYQMNGPKFPTWYEKNLHKMPNKL